MADGDLLFRNRSGTLSYYQPDGNMNERTLTDQSGTISDQYSYDAYGKTTHASGSNANPYQYKGQQYDSATALYNLRARYYTPTQGRFLSRDTASFDTKNPVELNRYVYTGDEPVNRTDPRGTSFVDYTQILQYVQKDGRALNMEGQWERNLLAGDTYWFAAWVFYGFGVFLYSLDQAKVFRDEDDKEGCHRTWFTEWPAVTVALGAIDPLANGKIPVTMLKDVIAVKGNNCPGFRQVLRMESWLDGAWDFIDQEGTGFSNHAERVLYRRYSPLIPSMEMPNGSFYAIGIGNPNGLCGEEQPDGGVGGMFCRAFFVDYQIPEPRMTWMTPSFLYAIPYDPEG
jgi:RHS repeat-associated protein